MSDVYRQAINNEEISFTSGTVEMPNKSPGTPHSQISSVQRAPENTKSLLNELRQLVKASQAGDFSVTPDINSLSGEDREAALLVCQILDNYKVAVDYDMMKYKFANSELGIAHWEIDIMDNNPADSNNIFKWSPELCQMLKFSDSGVFTDSLSNWWDRVHPDDKDMVMVAFSAHVTDQTEKTPFNLKHRIKMKSGEYCYVHAIGTTLRDIEGVPLRVSGALEIITDKKQMDVNLKLVRLADSGAFVELENGIEGHIHISQVNHNQGAQINEVLPEKHVKNYANSRKMYISDPHMNVI